MAKKKTIKQRRDIRTAKKAEIRKPAGGDPIDKVIAAINGTLGGEGYVFRGADIEKREYARRSSGIPSLDYVLNGGLPYGGLVELGGEYSCGKTTLALHCAAEAQRAEPERAVGWVALEPFSKRWARENGLFLPFNEACDDSWELATPLERFRMEQVGITDPYAEVSPFVLVQDERGDVALDTAIDMLRSNQFAIVVVDSLGVAKSTKWVEETETQDASDFPREPKMIGDYTTRALLSLNKRYDENNQIARDGGWFNQTTLLHLNQIGVNIGAVGYAPWKKYRLKGGEANKHNHHAIVFIWKGGVLQAKVPNNDHYIYGQETRIVGLKSKIGPPFLQGSFDFYFRDYDTFHAGDIDVGKDAVALGLMAGLIQRGGSWFTLGDDRFQGREALAQYLRGQDEVRAWVLNEGLSVLRSGG